MAGPDLVAKFPAPPGSLSSLQGSLVSAWIDFWPRSFLVLGLQPACGYKGQEASVEGRTFMG